MNNLEINNQLDEVTKNLILHMEKEIKSKDKEIESKDREIVYIRNKPLKNTGKKDNLSNLEIVTIEHELPKEESTCSECNSSLVVIGKKEKDILKYVPAKIYIERHVTYSYACKSCEANIISTKSPSTILHKSMASNDILVHSICLKYLYSLPLYRKENYFKMLDVNLSRQTLSNWMLGAANELSVVYDLMKKELLKSNYI